MVISNFKVFIVFVALGLPFPQVHLSVGGGGGGGGQQASSLSSRHKLWNFHRYLLVYYIPSRFEVLSMKCTAILQINHLLVTF